MLKTSYNPPPPLKAEVQAALQGLMADEPVTLLEIEKQMEFWRNDLIDDRHIYASIGTSLHCFVCNFRPGPVRVGALYDVGRGLVTVGALGRTSAADAAMKVYSMVVPARGRWLRNPDWKG